MKETRPFPPTVPRLISDEEHRSGVESGGIKPLGGADMSGVVDMDSYRREQVAEDVAFRYVQLAHDNKCQGNEAFQLIYEAWLSGPKCVALAARLVGEWSVVFATCAAMFEDQFISIRQVHRNKRDSLAKASVSYKNTPAFEREWMSIPKSIRDERAR